MKNRNNINIVKVSKDSKDFIKFINKYYCRYNIFYVNKKMLKNCTQLCQ